MKQTTLIFIVILLLIGCGGGSNPPQDDGGNGVHEISTKGSKLIKTGQKISYKDEDDGYYKKGLARSYTRDDVNHIVTDNTTKLMWHDDTSSVETKLWQEAVDYCQESQLGGFDDWRLPSIVELGSLIDFGKLRPAINEVFQNIDNKNYWSSTKSANNPSNIKTVSFEIGRIVVVSKSYQSYGGNRFRCVRELEERR